MNNKKHLVPTMAFFIDIVLSYYTYSMFTNYEKFKKIAKATIPDPDFQLQVYQILVQALTFTLIIFLTFHLIMYFLVYKSKKFAIKYMRFYLITACISLVISMFFSFDIFYLFGGIAYGLAYSKLKTAEL
jgi:hypothetical protein